MRTRRASPRVAAGKKRSRVEVQLNALDAACAAPRSAEAGIHLRAALRDGHALVAARAAKVIREQTLEGFAADLERTFRRFLPGAGCDDTGCLAKVAVLEALDFDGHDDAGVFLEATRVFQPEAAWGPPIDTAAGVRARGVLALGRLAHPDLSVIAGALLADPLSPVRQAAAEALASTGERAFAGALALRFSLGDEDPLVSLACAVGLLALTPEHALPRLRAGLHGPDEGDRDLAALALGQSARPEALELLLEQLNAAPSASERAVMLRALGLQRNDRALEALLRVVSTGSRRDAQAAIAGLGTRRFDAGVRDRTREAVCRSDHAEHLKVAFDASFPPDDRATPSK